MRPLIGQWRADKVRPCKQVEAGGAQKADTETGFDKTHQCRKALDAQASAYDMAEFGSVLVKEPVQRAGMVNADAFMRHDIREGNGPCGRQQCSERVLGRGDDPYPVIFEGPGFETRKIVIIGDDRDIGQPVLEGRKARGRRRFSQIDRHIGIALRKPRQKFGQPARQRRASAGKTQRTALSGGMLTHDEIKIRYLAHHPPGSFEISISGNGGAHALGRTIKQGDTEPRFEITKASADGRGGNVLFFSGAADRALFGQNKDQTGRDRIE
ncbi:hypothetical protein GCM10007989_30280 [Devosia pacifica]|uniref:Uncharacterized protein n=1 Tax=Devosia pacifica TaxID=1335967 RepID=A0A918VWT8_9HYPH|nr:hypothetical protein GCM10007989_30280 [Devosia pacifica]